MRGLSIHLLGPFEICIDGEPVVDLHLERVRALLAYLCLESRRPHLRETLSSLLWPEAGDAAARANLRQAIYKLKLGLGEHQGARFLQVSRDVVQLNPDAPLWVDAAAFSALVQSTRLHGHVHLHECPVCLANLREALQIYRGDFLSGVSLPDSISYQEWAAGQQARLRDQMLQALSVLSQCAWQNGDLDEAEALALRHLAVEPWSEEAHRLRMRVAAATGRRTTALHQYDVCRQVLAGELGVDPDPTTEALYAEIKASTNQRSSPLAVPPPDRRTVKDAGLVPSPPARRPGPALVPAGDLLAPQLQPVLIGRERESAWLDAQLQMALQGNGRVAFVTGSVGSGKTALLSDFASRALQAAPDLVCVSSRIAMAGDLGGLTSFVEILRLLAGDLTAHRSAPGATNDHLQRARAAYPDLLAALGAEGPELTGLIPWPNRLPEGSEPGPEALGYRGDRAAQPGYLQTPRLDVLTLADQLLRTLHRYARVHPLVIILHDLQWLGQDASALFFHLASNLTRSRILLLCSYRSGAAMAAPIVARMIDELRGRHGEIEVDLDEVDGRRFVEAYLAAEDCERDAALVDAVYARTDGHPLFTIELVRRLKGDGGCLSLAESFTLKADDEPVLAWTRLPARLDAALRERLASLPPDWQRTLEVASIQGASFYAEVVAEVKGEALSEIIGQLSDPRMARCHLVHAVGVSTVGNARLSLYRFDNAFLRDLLYTRLDQVRRTHWHEAAGAALERLLGPVSDMASSAA